MAEFSQFGRTLIIIGLLVTAVGIFLVMGDKVPWLGRLPGDIFIKGKKFSLYFPIATSIVISIILSCVFFFFRHK